jgi:cyanobactin maturation PatA/PatG family protease
MEEIATVLDVLPAFAPPRAAAPHLVYVLGRIGYDFGSEARRDFFVRDAGDPLFDPENILPYLQDRPEAAEALIWTLSIDDVPVYAIAPRGPFAATAYARLRDAFGAQVSGEVERVSIAGVLAGSALLQSGQVVAVIVPDLRGFGGWSTSSLVTRETRNLVERIAAELRNVGRRPEDRAMNFAATETLQTGRMVADNVAAGRALEAIDVERAPICRPCSDCWDVKLTFFNPARRLEESRMVYRLTVDVSDVVPVTVGKIRHWEIY